MNSWQVTTPLMSHQRDAVAKLLPSRVNALYMDMGTGKTRTTIELAHLRQHKIDRVVWFCPVSVKHTIAKELLKHTTATHDDILIFDHKTSNQTKTIRDKPWVIVGIESMSSSARVTGAIQHLIDDQTMVVVDESTYIKGYHSNRTRRITLLSKIAKYRAILTGTPLTQGVVDLYAQMYFLSPAILGYNSFYAFAKNHLEYETVKLPSGKRVETNRIVAAHDVGYLAARVAPYAYQITKDECLDLPKKIYTSYSFALTDEQKQAYFEAKERFVDRITNQSEWDISSLPILRLFGELQGIVCGFLTVGQSKTYFEHERVNLLKGVVADIAEHEKVVIWGKYRHCVDQIIEGLSNEYGNEAVTRYDGSLSETKRAQSIEKWTSSGRFLVATQASGGHGLNELVIANHVVFYANGFKYSERLQAEDRTHRIGQTKSCWYADLYARDTIDQRIDSNLNSKGWTMQSFMQNIARLKKEKDIEGLAKLIRDL